MIILKCLEIYTKNRKNQNFKINLKLKISNEIKKKFETGNLFINKK